MKEGTFLLLIVLALMKATAFLFIKASVQHINPFAVAFLRVSLALPILYFVSIYKYQTNLRKVFLQWKKLLLLSFTSVIIPFSLISWGGKFIPSGISAVYMALVPIFVAIFEIKFRKNSNFSLVQYISLILGFFGVGLLFFDAFTANFNEGILGHSLCLCSSIFYAFSIYTTKKLLDIPPILIGTTVFTFSSIILFPIFYFLFPITIDAFKLVVIPISGLALISTAGSTILMYYLVSKVGTIYTSMTNYLVPIFGIGLGYLFFAEQPSIMLLPAISCIFISLYLVSKSPKMDKTFS